jgi:Baseplate J-like protein
MARYVCSDEERRAEVEKSALNGIDFLEVLDVKDPAHPEWEPLRQLVLGVRLFKPAPDLTAANVRLEGGVRLRVRVLWALPFSKLPAGPEKDLVTAYFPPELRDDGLFVVRTSSSGDYSTYRLRLVKAPSKPEPPDTFDPRLSEVEFSFKVECPTDFDCKPAVRCAPKLPEEPEISYLAKDYASFRRLMLDRLAAIAPDWRERNAADVGIALVEILAYVGDQLSYYQDAVATEAYLSTARKRASVRRHARLVDYFLHEGTNARAWVAIGVRQGSPADGKQPLLGPHPEKSRPGTRILTRWSAGGAVVSYPELDKAATAGATIFETLHDITLHAAHNEIAFYTWSDRECCLPAGATAATLEKPLVDLKEGQVLLFEELIGPQTGDSADADPRHRHVVRLTKVTAATDRLPNPNKEVVEIEWDPADALPFPLCVSAVTDDEHGSKAIDRVSVARGNLVLADHGFTVADEPLGEVPEGRRFRPLLERGPLTHAQPLPAGFAKEPASILTGYRPEDAAPAVYLEAGSEHWSPRRDLLASGKFDEAFVAEVEEDGRARLRFGDDESGKAPAGKTSFTATYRVGNGTAGNVGPEALCHMAVSPADGIEGIEKVRNPLPATGGVERESLEQARQYAPQAFRRQQRAVTEADYAGVAERHPEVQRAAATFRWTGSWYTVFSTVDRVGGRKVDADFETRLRRAHLERYRMAGYDLEVDGPRFVPLDLTLQICVKPDYFRSQVKAALLERFSNRVLADGRRGFFHPDEWTFGQPVHLSRIYAAASEVEGIDSVKVVVFKRLGRLQQQEIEDGVLALDRLEIAVLDNDPNFQENGRLELSLGGGK